ncbi:MAG: DEAD/DEAH box helicase family protein [Actinobacteria bacterium]|nr:DEAD/DEAH box helicase family protein [Actinomycetota bacterium]MCL6088375.1 DEAD/DEAH box helicase family protein [Actinomycetota bacterium]
MQKEAKARIKINKLLEESGWRLIDNKNGRANVILEPGINIKELGDDFENVHKGYIDYLLLDEQNFPICVLEAKSEDKDSLVGKEQARKYANSQNVRFIILSNGNIHYLWDKKIGNPTRIAKFPTLLNFKSQKEFSPNIDKLINLEINEDFIVKTQYPQYISDPSYLNSQTRDDFISDKGLRFLRQYQLAAVKAVQKTCSEGKNRFLLEMATGTGKTLVSAAIIKLYLKSKNARRVLFLVDRLELENQANKNFRQYLHPDYTSVIFKENKDDWIKANIVVTTIQSLSYDNKYLKLFSPNDFDLIISDEAHRSISGSSRQIFEYFIGAKLGLTATPKDYLKNLNEKELSESDPREFERRELLSTYKTFGCQSSEPTYRYTLADGVRDGYLINPVAIDCRTEITTKLLSDEGYAILTKNDNDEDVEIVFSQKDFEKKFFSEKTNSEFVKTFMQNANKDPISSEIGKSIIFCVSQKHATKITQLLNEYAHAMYPQKYNSDFAVQVTSYVEGAQQMSINFANNNLNGHTNFLKGYKSSKTRVCVTVAMMTTGYDCMDVLNLCLLRPIFSPTEFIQIKGRGTRTHTFKLSQRVTGVEKIVKEEKQNYKLFDFFANCEYFEEKYPYDEILKLPKVSEKLPQPFPPTPTVTKGDTYTDMLDPLKKFLILEFPDGIMRVDREMYINKFENKIKTHYETKPDFKEAIDSGNNYFTESFIKEHVLNKPEEYFTLEKIRNAYLSDRRLSINEILDKIFGKIVRFKSKEELAEDEFEKFKVDCDIETDKYYETKEFFKNYLLEENFRTKINQKEFRQFADNPEILEILKKLGQEKLKNISEYIKDNINLNQFV